MKKHRKIIGFMEMLSELLRSKTSQNCRKTGESVSKEKWQNNKNHIDKRPSRGDSPRLLLKDGNCNCEWIGKGDLATPPCGGCENNVRLYRDDPIHWRNKHWHLRCAFEQAKSELGNEKTK